VAKKWGDAFEYVPEYLREQVKKAAGK
jgi:hypothetical protein